MNLLQRCFSTPEACFPQLSRPLVLQLFTRWVLFVQDVFYNFAGDSRIFFAKLCSWSKEICLPLAYLPDNNIFCYRSFSVEDATFFFVLKSLEDFSSFLCVSRHLHRTETFLSWAIEKIQRNITMRCLFGHCFYFNKRAFYHTVRRQKYLYDYLFDLFYKSS